MQGKLYITDLSGHTTIEWDTDKREGPLDPAHAEREFNRLVSGGWLGYGTTAHGKSEQLTRFDETFPKVTATPPLVGG